MGVDQAVSVIEGRRAVFIQVHFIVERRRGAGLAKVGGAILHPENAVGSGTGGSGEDATPCASSYGIRALVAVEGHRLVRTVHGVTGKQVPAKALLLVPKAKMPLDPTVALVKLVPYRVTENGSEMTVEQSSQWLPVSVTPGTSVPVPDVNV